MADEGPANEQIDAQANTLDRSRRNWQRLATPVFAARFVLNALRAIVDGVTLWISPLDRLGIKPEGVTPPFIGLVAKGDLITRGSSATAILSVGTSGQSLRVNAGSALGIQWTTDIPFVGSTSNFYIAAPSGFEVIGNPNNGQGTTTINIGTGVLTLLNALVVPNSITAPRLFGTSTVALTAGSAGSSTFSLTSSTSYYSGLSGTSTVALTAITALTASTANALSGALTIVLNSKLDTSTLVLTNGTAGADFAIAQTGATWTFNLPVADATHTGKLDTATFAILSAKIGSGVQSIVGGTAGTDFVVTQAGGAVTLDLPVADATHTGKLNTATYATFNAKLGSAVQSVVSGTTGSDFAVSQVGSAVTLNLPFATSSVTGKLGTDTFSTFNNKLGSVGTVLASDPLRVNGTTTAPMTSNVSFSGSFGFGKHFQSGTLYSSPANTQYAGQFILTALTVVAVPFYVGKITAFDQIAFYVGTAVALSSTGAAIYNDSNGLPGSLVVDAGTVATTATGIKTLSIAVTLQPGMYWLAVASDLAVRINGNKAPCDYIMGINTSFNSFGYFQKTTVLGSLVFPDPFGAGTFQATSTAAANPGVLLRAT